MRKAACFFEKSALAVFKAHRGRINSAAAAALVGNGISGETAKAIVSLIAKGSIPRVTINY